MNIFYLSRNLKNCAKYHCDKHVVKMMTEYAQILSTAHRVLDGNETVTLTKSGRRYTRYLFEKTDWREPKLYKSVHAGHPSVVWTYSSREHYVYLYDLWVQLHEEFKRRYNKNHASYDKLWDALMMTPKNIEDNGWTDPPPAIKGYDWLITSDIVETYRNFYIHDKKAFATWKTTIPHWWRVV